MARARWITGKALETFKALRAIKVGDHVKIGPCFVCEQHNAARDKFYYGRVGKVVEIDLDNQHGFAYRMEYPQVEEKSRRHCVCGIKAWRPSR